MLHRMRTLFQLFLAVIEIYRDRHISRGAAAVSYYLLLALFPMAGCVSVLLYRFALMPSLWYDALTWLGQVLESVGGAWETPDTGTSSVLFAAAFALLLSASAGAFRCLWLGAADITQHPIQPCADMRMRAHRMSGIAGAVIGYLFATLLFFAVYAAVFLLTVWEELTALAAHSMGANALTELLFASRYPVMLGLFLCLCIGLMRILPPHLPIRKTLPGAVFCTIGLSCVTAFFALFIRTSAKYSLVYGSLASMVLFLTWLFLCGNLLLIGIAVNAVCANDHIIK